MVECAERFSFDADTLEKLLFTSEPLVDQLGHAFPAEFAVFDKVDLPHASPSEPPNQSIGRPFEGVRGFDLGTFWSCEGLSHCVC